MDFQVWLGLSRSQAYFQIHLYNFLREYTLLKNSDLAPSYIKTNFKLQSLFEKPEHTSFLFANLFSCTKIRSMLLGSLFTLLPYRFFKFLIHQSLEKLDSVYIQKLSQSYSHGLTLQNLKGYRALCKRQKTGSKDHAKVLELKAKINIMKFTKVFFCHSFLLQVFFSVRRSSSISRIFLYQYNFLILVEVWLNV